jgi:hypothetical protein
MSKVTLFSQKIKKLNHSRFNKLVKFHQSDKHQKGFNSWSHLVTMLFCKFQRANLFEILAMALKKVVI